MKSYRKLFWRLYPSYFLLTVLSLAAVGGYTIIAVQDFFLRQTVSDLEARARIAGEQIRDLLHFPRQEAAALISRRAGSASGTRITVILPSGKVIGDSENDPRGMDNHAHRPEIRKALEGSAGSFTRYSNTLKTEMMYVAVPITDENRIIGVVRTAMPMDAVNTRLLMIQRRHLLAGAVVTLLAAAVCFIISRRISRPIEEMRKGAEAFAAGNFDYRLPQPRSEEISKLAEAMSRMAEELDLRIQTISRQRNLLEAVLSSMREGVLAIDAEERIISLNPAAVRMLRLESGQIEGRPIQEMIRNTRFQQMVTRTLEGGEPDQEEISFFDDDLILNISGARLTDAFGKQMGALMVCHDITRLRRLENMKRDFAANVSHELKTPLTAIKGFVETLMSGTVEEPEETDRFLGIIHRHTLRITAIIEDLMRLSEIEQIEDIPLEKRRIREVTDSAVEFCRLKAGKRRISLESDCDDRLSALVNPRFLEQAVMNLVDNAVKYSPEGSTVTVKTEKSENEVIIRVQDQGIGIPREHLPRIFERFYRVDKSRSRKMGGTGLGLAIVKHIVQSHRGSVKVESRMGQGSVFEIHLPV